MTTQTNITKNQNLFQDEKDDLIIFNMTEEIKRLTIENSRLSLLVSAKNIEIRGLNKKLQNVLQSEPF